MTKKDVSRRGFLKGIFQSASAMGLATVLKFVPEAKEVLASDRLEYDMWTLPRRNTDILKQIAFDDTNVQILRNQLDTEGFQEIPGLYFAYRTKTTGRDENQRMHTFHTDHLIVGCTNEDNRGALLCFLKDSHSRSSQWQAPLLIVQDEALFYVEAGQVISHDDREHQLISSHWFERTNRGLSPLDNISPLLDHGPCSRIMDQCVSASIQCAILTACCVATVGCCFIQVAACSNAIAQCILASDCCDVNPGTHDC
ncbi:hypothetical protein [Candidatus Leptofilum sp.]|uniref:hypothetical protein n=1 Tax=Candidatus Leptofilum sp. TaxID=3241576 RepID=UPI003B5C4C99